MNSGMTTCQKSLDVLEFGMCELLKLLELMEWDCLEALCFFPSLSQLH